MENENVVLSGNDPMQKEKKAFFEINLKNFHLHSKDAILKYLKDEIKKRLNNMKNFYYRNKK